MNLHVENHNLHDKNVSSGGSKDDDDKVPSLSHNGTKNDLKVTNNKNDDSKGGVFQPPTPKMRHHHHPPHHKRINSNTNNQSLMDLFQPPPPASFDRQPTIVMSNKNNPTNVTTMHHQPTELELLFRQDNDPKKNKQIKSKNEDQNYSTMTPSTSQKEPSSSLPSYHHRSMPPNKRDTTVHLKDSLKDSCNMKDFISAIVGSCTYVLYHVVYSLSQGSAIQSKRVKPPLLGPLARMGALGCTTAGPFMIHILNDKYGIPSAYPSVDAFLVPFYALLARVIDEKIPFEKKYEEDIEEIWLATFTFSCAMGMILSATMIYLATIFKLANLGAFLPYPVLCGFFTAIGIMIEELALSVDTDGMTIKEIFFCPSNYMFVLQHHAPSLLTGTIMFIISKKYTPVLTPALSVGSILCVYLVMYITGTSLREAQYDKWFWTKDAFDSDPSGTNPYRVYSVPTIFQTWSPPAPMGFWASLWKGKVYFPAVAASIPVLLAMATIYLVRCSLLAPAYKKNASNMAMWKRDREQKMEDAKESNYNKSSGNDEGQAMLDKKISPNEYFISIESMDQFDDKDSKHNDEDLTKETKQSATVADLLKLFSFGQYVVALVGGFPCLPSIAAGSTMFKLGAEKKAPQYGALILFFFFYLTEFDLVSYIPKCAFSSLLILCCFELLSAWFIDSYKKMHNKGEWLVVPVIVFFSFAIDILSAVGLGIALSTFVFVGTFYRTGVVKFLSNGLTLRSTVERGIGDDEYLDMYGDLIQVLVLQNYLFFGNASSCSNYITTMFEEITEVANGGSLGLSLPPIPKYLIIDLAFVTGFDTSAIDVFVDIVMLCKSHDCMVYMTGITREQKRKLAIGGLKPSTKRGSLFSKLKFFQSMEIALGKAEDGILKQFQHDELIRTEKRAERNDNENGFSYALEQIDAQHGVSYASKLKDLESFTSVIELKTGESLYANGDGPIDEMERGLFFIEHGLMRVERDSSYTTARSIRSNGNSLRRRDPALIYGTPRLGATSSIGQMNARTPSIGRELTMLKVASGHRSQRDEHNFRLARIGPGWVVGDMEGSASLRNPGLYVAVTHCRLHHVPYHKIEEIELENPTLILNLFKLMARLTARRQEITIGQLATIHSIVTSPTPTVPISRMTLGAIKSAMGSMNH